MIEDAFAYLTSMDKNNGENILCIFNTNSNAYNGLVTGSIDIPNSLFINDFEIVDRSTGNKIDFAVLDTWGINKVKYNAFYGHPARIPGN